MYGRLDKVLRRALRRADLLLQPHFRVTQEFFIHDPEAVPGQDVPTAREWSTARKRGDGTLGADPSVYESDRNYLRYLLSVHDQKIRAALSLAAEFDFSRYSRIIELGCGDMLQAFVVCTLHPELVYTATDFDPYVIEQCARVPLLRGIRKDVVDVVESDLSMLKGHDLVVSWSLEFSLNDDQLRRVFRACREHSVPYLLCTHAAIGPVECLLRRPAVHRQRKLARTQRVRRHGWLRSLGAVSRLAREAGMRLQWRSYHVNHAVALFGR